MDLLRNMTSTALNLWSRLGVKIPERGKVTDRFTETEFAASVDFGICIDPFATFSPCRLYMPPVPMSLGCRISLLTESRLVTTIVPLSAYPTLISYLQQQVERDGYVSSLPDLSTLILNHSTHN